MGDYLTYEEFKSIDPLTDLDATAFKTWLTYATAIIDAATMFYYQNHDLSADQSFKGVQFRRALALQISDLYRTKVTTLESKRDRPDTVSIGRTSITNRKFSATTGESGSLISVDAYNALMPTGLLYRGTGYVY